MKRVKVMEGDEINPSYPDIDSPVVTVVVSTDGIETRYLNKSGEKILTLYTAGLKENRVITDTLINVYSYNWFTYNPVYMNATISIVKDELIMGMKTVHQIPLED